MKRLAFVLVIAAAAAAGCTDRKVCNYAAPGAIPAEESRDPSTGLCQAVSQPYPCDNACGPCPASGVAQPAWPTCTGACEGLTEAQCLASTSCHTAYATQPNPSNVFLGCWDITPLPQLDGGPCTNLDATTCLEHDDCTSLYTGPANQGSSFVPSFVSCGAKPSSLCSQVDCGAGNECVVTPSSATQVACVTIAAAGACSGTVTCATAQPVCPSGTTPGIANGCYTGYCIPMNECTAPACSSLTTETACMARSDCDTVYMGSNCTCDKTGCTCQTETFLRCQ